MASSILAILAITMVGRAKYTGLREKLSFRYLAPAKRSDSGERRELGKASEKTRGDWGEEGLSVQFFRVFFACSSQLRAVALFFALSAPLSEHLEQAIRH